MGDGTSEYIENLNVGDEVLSLDFEGFSSDEDLGRDVWMQLHLERELFTKHKSMENVR